MLTDDVMTPEELKARWHITTRTLANQRSLGKGPSFIKLGRSVLYRVEDVIAYEEAHYIKTAA